MTISPILDAATRQYADEQQRAADLALLREFALKALPVIEAAQWYADEYDIAEDAGELQHWPEGEAERCRKIRDALAPFKGE